MKRSKISRLLMALMFSLALTQVAVADEQAHWSYEEGEHGPAHWGELSPDYELCSKGRKQSPVNIPRDAPANTPDIEFNYHPSALTLSNNGHTIQVDYDPGSSITVEGKTYNLLQFHFHNPSEHTYDGYTFSGAHEDMEAHFVHKSADGKLAVIAVLLDKWLDYIPSNYDPVFAHWQSAQREPETIEGAKVHALSMLPGGPYYRYDGSLTTPPCSEDVKWFVFRNPIKIGRDFVTTYQVMFGPTARPTQPLNGRIFFSNLPPTVGMPVTGSNSTDDFFPVASVALVALILVSSGLALSRRKA
jgi:carbonic anhydrase